MLTVIPDPGKRTVKIPVRIIDGRVKFLYEGTDLPIIRDTVGDLVIPAHALKTADDANLSFEAISEILPPRSILMIDVRIDEVGQGLITRKSSTDVPELPLTAIPRGFVRVELCQTLRLLHRGTKSSVLCECNCILPDINEQAISLNHAYSIASRRFETKRRANTGNVFLHVYHKADHGWEQLEWLRERTDARFEKRYVEADTRVPEDLDDHSLQIDSAAELRADGAPPFFRRFHPDPKNPFFESAEYSVDANGLDELLCEAWYPWNGRFWRYNKRGAQTALPLRIHLAKFKQSKGHRRIMRINSDLEVRRLPLSKQHPDEEHLFQKHRSRLMNAPETLPEPEDNGQSEKFCVFEAGRLIALSYFQSGERSSYGYYAFFDPNVQWRSLGILTMLLEIEYSKSQGNRYYYPGYSYQEPSRLDYKKRFHGLESYDWTGSWQPFERLKEADTQA
ncbi:MAG: hypothetical protein JO053_06120 [Acidobacteria bacterium]|nr:hypothetical protein [Acidobacteriota bacterium]